MKAEHEVPHLQEQQRAVADVGCVSTRSVKKWSVVDPGKLRRCTFNPWKNQQDHHVAEQIDSKHQSGYPCGGGTNLYPWGGGTNLGTLGEVVQTWVPLGRWYKLVYPWGDGTNLGTLGEMVPSQSCVLHGGVGHQERRVADVTKKLVDGLKDKDKMKITKITGSQVLCFSWL